MSDNPFDEPIDQDRTVIRPSPGGRRGGVARSEPAAAVEMGPAEAIALGDNPLIIAAMPLLQLLARLRNTANPPDAGDLRSRVMQQLQRFEQAVRAAGVSMEAQRPAHFALCASLDDVVLNTPWGMAGDWAKAPLVANFHPALGGPDRFVAVLAKLRREAGKHLPVIELMYYCLSLGFMGSFRTAHGGAEALQALRAEVAAEISAARPAVAHDLSPRWRGVAAPFRRRRAILPVWVVLSLVLALIGAMFAASLSALNAASDVLSAQALQVSPARMPDIARAALAVPPPPAPSEPGTLSGLRAALATQKALAVLGTDTTPIIRIPASSLFAADSARLAASAAPVIAAIAMALRVRPGGVAVLGYTDATPMRTVQFPSNFQFSTARARAVQVALQQGLGMGRPVTAEGRAEADPVADNATAAGRSQNQRIEIVLQPQAAGQ